MTKLIAVIGLLTCVITTGLAQNRANIKGKVVDSINKETMEFATVAVLNRKDSSLVSYTTTLKTGEFNLHNLPAGVELKLVISFVGYDNYRKYFTLNKGESLDLGTIKMGSKNGILTEVKIRGEAVPIQVKKDTIEFNTEAFKTPPNAVVEDLLKRLPGIEVDFNGNITLNGKAVNKLLIDGKQFFANDPRIASKTLDAAMIDKVQVYDDRDDDPDHLVPDSKVSKIINLKLKSAIKRSTTGKVHGGYGTRDRFDAGLLYSTFRDTLQVSAIIISNNLNRTGFTQGELSSLGGFNRSGTDALNYGGLAFGGQSGGIQTLGSGGLNVNNDYGKKLKINLLYYYSYTSDVYNSSAFTRRFFDDNTLRTLPVPHTDTLSSNSTSSQHNISNKHSISSLVEWKPDTMVSIRYQPKINFSATHNTSINTGNSFNNFAGPVNVTDNNSESRSTNFQFQQSFSYYRRLHKKGASLNISHNFSITDPNTSQNYSLNDLISFTSALPSSNLDRLGDNASQSSSGGLNISLRYPLSKKLTGTISSNNNYNYNHGRVFTYNLNPTTGLYNIYIDSLSRNLVRRQFNETVKPELAYAFDKAKQIVLTAGLNIQFTQVYNQFNKNVPDINRSETYVMPAISFYGAGFSVSYDQYVNQPSINDLLPYTTFYNQLASSVGNPNLKPTRTHAFYGSYYFNKPDRLLSGGININYSFDDNSIFNQSTVNSQGGSISRPTNKTGSYYNYTSASLSKGFKKFNNWQIRLSDRVSGNYRHNFFQVNAQQGFQNTTSFTFNQAVYINYNNKFEVNPSYSISPSITTYQNVAYSDLKYVSQNLTVPVIVKGIKHYSIEGNYSYAYNPLVTAGFRKSSNVVNLSFARLFQYRDRAEIKLSVYDLFDQNINAYRFANGNVQADQQTEILKRYFLLTYTWRFVSTVTKK